MKDYSRFLLKFSIMLIVFTSVGMNTEVTKANESDFDYLDNGDGTATITGYKGNSSEVEIPEEIDGLSVTRIGNAAFIDKSLTKIAIPASVTSIDPIAFKNNLLTSVEIPGSVTSIGEEAFRNNLLTSVEIHEGVEIIGQYAFRDNQLTSVEIPGSVTIIRGNAFFNNELTSVIIHEGVREINAYAFAKNNLTIVEIPASVSSIVGYTFDDNPLKVAVIRSNNIDIEFQPFPDADTVIIASNQSNARTYAINNGNTFIALEELVLYEPNGKSWSQSAETELTVNSMLTAHYQWSQSDSTPVWPSEDWIPYNSGTIFAPDETGIWYLHVAVVKENTELVLFSQSEPFYIDRTAPNIELDVSSAWTSQNVEVTVTANDSDSDVNEVKYAFGKYSAADFATDGTSLDLTDLRIIVPDNGWLSVYAKDNAGNETVEQIEITNIDRAEPSITLTPSTVDPTNQDVVVTAAVSDDKSGVKLLKWAYGEQSELYFDTGGTEFGSTFTATENGTYTVYAEDNAGNKAVEHILIENIFKTGPAILLTPQVTVPTNQPVTVTAEVYAQAGVAEVKYDFGQHHEAYFASDGTPLDLADLRITVSDNGWLSVYAKDHAGNETVEHIEITNIDRIKPAITLTPSSVEPTNQDVVVTAAVSDDKSGVKLLKWAYGEQSELYFDTGGTEFTSSFAATLNGTYTVYAEDNAGNKAVEHILIENIFKTGPAILLTPQVTVPTNQPVTVTAAVYAQAGVAEVKYEFGQHHEAFFASGGTPLDLADLRITVSDNGWLSVYAKDHAGNETVEHIEITNIDRIKPAITLTPSTVEPTNQDVVVTAAVNDDGSGVKEIKWAYGEQSELYFDTGGTKFISSFAATLNGTYTVYAEDNAGNKAVEHILIENIFKTGPAILLTPQVTVPTNQPVTVTAAVYAQTGVAEVKYDFGQHHEVYFASGGTPLDLADLRITVSDNGWLSVYAKDHAGNETVEHIEIANIDQVKPVITLLGDSAMRVQQGAVFSDPGYTAWDDVDGDITDKVTVSGDTVDTSKAGEYTILYDVTDAAGNTAEQAKRTVHVYVPSSESSAGEGGGVAPNQWVVYAEEGKTIQWKSELMLHFHEGATEQMILVTVTEVSETASLDETYTIVSNIFEIVKDKSGHFRKPVTISIKFDPAKVGANQTVSIFYYDEETQKWINIGGSVDGVWIHAEVDHFTKFAVFAVDTEEATPPKLMPAFSDIAGHWGEPYIIEAAEKKLIQGYPDGSFRPNHSITRAEFLEMLVKALQLEGADGTLSFTDQEKIGSWARDAIAIAVQKGIVSGYEDGSFRPDAPITRAEMAVMVARALGLGSGGESRTAFADDQDIPSWAKGAAEALRRQGIIHGREGLRFASGDPASRAEATVILLKMME